MKKIYLLGLLMGLLWSCRKDNSTFLNSSRNNNSKSGDKCLITGSKQAMVGLDNVITYQSDSIISSIVYKDPMLSNEYLVKESSGSYLYSDGSKELKDVKYRVYLNSFGAVSKEVKLKLNADNKTFTEISTDKNTYTYNAKNQLIKMYRGLDPDDVSFFELTYDQSNKISKILTYDKEGGSLYCTYDNFKFSTEKKKDNLFQLGFDDSIGVMFIPSLRNYYVTHYEMNFEGLGLPPDTFDFEIKFSGGTLSTIKYSYVVFGFSISDTLNFTVNCK